MEKNILIIEQIRRADRLIQLQNLYVKFFNVAHEDKRQKYELLLNRVQHRRIRDRLALYLEEIAKLYESALPFHNLKAKMFGE